VHRRLIPTLAAVALLVAACTGAGPAIDDPKEIVAQGLEATTQLTSMHIALTLDGTATIAEAGGEMTLDGTTLEGDVDLDQSVAHITFAMPSMLGLSGELIQVGDDSYVKTSMTGPMWLHSTAATGDTMPGVEDTTGALDGLRDFLDTEGVTVEKLSDTDCGDGRCYAVRMTIPPDVLTGTDGVADGLTGLDPSAFLGDGLVLDLLFDRDDLYLADVSTELSAESVGSVSLRLTLSAFNEDVSVEAPPADQVTDGGDFGLPF
jgi:hypothetical protein